MPYYRRILYRSLAWQDAFSKRPQHRRRNTGGNSRDRNHHVRRVDAVLCFQRTRPSYRDRRITRSLIWRRDQDQCSFANSAERLANGGRRAVAVLALGGGWLTWSLHRSTTARYVTQKVEPGSMVRTVTASGIVGPAATAPVIARVSGVIQALECDVKMKVKAGQICAKIDPR